MLKDLFQSKKKYATITASKKIDIKEKKLPAKSAARDDKEDDGIWMKCSGCDETILVKDFEENMYVCPKCDKHGRLGAKDRIKSIIDDETFVEYYKDIRTGNPIGFPEYESKLEKARLQSELEEGVIAGSGKLDGFDVNLGVMEPKFMMGSMGSVVGEKITRLIEDSVETKKPLVLFCASGGARMQEGILSLMQMAKTSAALSKLDDEGVLFISVLTDPTTGGVSASFAMLGDIILAEPKVLIGFAGPRVVEQTIRQKLPEGFQTSEFLLERGFVDKIVNRKEMKTTLAEIIRIHSLRRDLFEQNNG